MTIKVDQAQTAAINARRAHGPWSDLALHTIGWRAFQDLCSQVCEVVLGRPVEIFREAQDGGQDAVFLIPSPNGEQPIGTIQCKHTSDAGKALKVSDLTAEIGNVEELVKGGQADTYAFMTNMSVDAPVAAAMRAKLRELGVRKPHILGRQYIVRVIRSSARLRALVPQVYGLGDLTAIVDERLSEQSRALLDSWIPKLRTYVPTQAHRDAVNAISDHGVVLLLGNPASGKSAIGAIVSTIASENPDNTVLALTSPRDFEAGWNPNDPGRFFWIDDAFGSNVLRDDYVQDWASAFSKLRAAIKHGNRFLLTSRKHIYEAARRRLGQRNLAQFADGSAVVDVGELTFEEKAQIQAEQARQRALQERDAARTSGVFLGQQGGGRSASSGAAGALAGMDLAGLGGPAAAPPAMPSGAAPSAGSARRAFLAGEVDRRTTSAERLEQPVSPNVLQAGSVIAAALITGLRSDLPGQVTAQVTQNVYDSPTGRVLLIPQGARLIGDYDDQVEFGQRRVLLAWTRLILPDGRSIVLERQPVGDAAGFAGLEDRVDEHWGALAKAAGLSTLLSIGSQLAADDSSSELIRALRDGGQNTLNQAGQEIVRRQLSVPPTLTVRPGFPVRVLVTRDLTLSPWGASR